MWWMTDQKHRPSALGLQRLLGLGSYRTAWLWLQKLRHAMVRPGWDRLGGQVEVDETYLGDVEAGARPPAPEKQGPSGDRRADRREGNWTHPLTSNSSRLHEPARRLREARG